MSPDPFFEYSKVPQLPPTIGAGTMNTLDNLPAGQHRATFQVWVQQASAGRLGPPLAAVTLPGFGSLLVPRSCIAGEPQLRNGDALALDVGSAVSPDGGRAVRHVEARKLRVRS